MSQRQSPDRERRSRRQALGPDHPATDVHSRSAPAEGQPLAPVDRDLLAAILDVAEMLVTVLDREGRIVLFNQACQTLTGYSVDEVRGRTPWRALVPAEESAPVEDVFARLAAGERPVVFDNHWQTRDGGARLIHWRNTVLHDDNGDIAYVVGTGIDITEQRRAARALEDTRRHNDAILETAVDAIVTIDAEGTIVGFNPAARRLFGYHPQEVLGHDVKLLMPESYGREHDGYIRRYLRTGEPRIIGAGREVPGLRRDGTTVPLHLSVGEFEQDGRRYFTGILRDISDLKRAEEEARRRLDEAAHRARLGLASEMSSGLAHEINQPLSAIVTYAQACLRMLDGNGMTPERLRDSLRQIAAQGERAGEIVSHLRRFVRRGEHDNAPLDLVRLAREAVWLLEHDLRSRDVSAEVQAPEGPVTVTGDAVQLEQVLLNLIRNAIEAPAADRDDLRRLIVAVTAGGETVTLTVTDNGPGLADDDLERLFEPFYSTKADGVGQGLSISRDIVRAHGGEMFARNRPQGGAVVGFELPAESAEERQPMADDA